VVCRLRLNDGVIDESTQSGDVEEAVSVNSWLPVLWFVVGVIWW
jgi:hypothetical protein